MLSQENSNTADLTQQSARMRVYNRGIAVRILQVCLEQDTLEKEYV